MKKYIKNFLILTILLSFLFTIGCSFQSSKALKPVKISDKSIKYSNEKMEVDLKIPVISELKDKNIEKKLNDKIEKYILSFKEEIEKMAEEDYKAHKETPEIPYNLHSAISQYTVKYNKNGILSIPTILYSYTGGAHGMTYKVSYNFNLNDGSEILLKDLFKENIDYKSLIINEIKKQMKENKDMMYFDDAFNTVSKLEDNHPFYIEDDGIVVYYGLYEIAPYAAGIQEFKIPFTTLKDKIKFDF
ncbi:Protein of unknown function [Caloramator quimbayensis]|uniref:Deacetylase PdaC domain-containing protein n=1 Tax=Caloramator quimbayensis TaxID=1147123 RepID=A0A1T4XVD3_9CLOT|nr:DUF3298 and DUF4163 domain-containing protein [Caloramator quimbayensis]SKA93011.1 Protein of unknown function [Caloramator quimbayensis]